MHALRHFFASELIRRDRGSGAARAQLADGDDDGLRALVSGSDERRGLGAGKDALRGLTRCVW